MRYLFPVLHEIDSYYLTDNSNRFQPTKTPSMDTNTRISDTIPQYLADKVSLEEAIQRGPFPPPLPPTCVFSIPKPFFPPEVHDQTETHQEEQ
jgi:hypothetical protein